MFTIVAPGVDEIWSLIAAYKEKYAKRKKISIRNVRTNYVFIKSYIAKSIYNSKHKMYSGLMLTKGPLLISFLEVVGEEPSNMAGWELTDPGHVVT